MKTTRSLSVNQRLLTIGATAFIGFGAMIAVGWYQDAKIATLLADAQRIRGNVIDINEMRAATLEFMLAANAEIIGRDDKKVAPERLEIMTKAMAVMRANAPAAQTLAEAANQPELTATYAQDIDELDAVILGDLPKMIESGADEQSFSKAVDTINTAGNHVSTLFASLNAAGEQLTEKADLAVRNQSEWALYVQIALGLLGLGAMGILFPIHSSAIRRGVLAIRDSLERLGREQFDTPVDGLNRGDEFGAMALSAESLRQSALEKRATIELTGRDRGRAEAERAAREAARLDEETQIRLAVDSLATGLSHLADGDLPVLLHQPFRADLERVRSDFNRAMENLQRVLADVKGNSSSIEANAHQMRSAADDLSRRTEQQAASLEETSAALDQITSTVRNSSARADEANKMVNATRANAEESGKVVSEAMTAMQRIETASSEIGKIINVIDEIAFQTNLLALNAGVEAARAGEAGKGFAVVAQEVRALAGRAAGAAKDIKTLIARSTAEVQTGVQLVTPTRDALGHIVSDVGRINEIVNAIATSANEQAVGIHQINSAIAQMDQMTQQNAAMVEETNAASHTLAQDAGSLTELVARFQIPDRTVVRTLPKAATIASKPKISPARHLVDTLAGAFQNKSAAAVASAPNSNNWEEF